jgi:hypothetical protein
MDNEKTVIEKLTDAVKGAANSIVDAASNAAETSSKSNAARMRASSQQAAGTTNAQIFIPEATDAAAMPIPFTVPGATRKQRKAQAKPAPAKIPRKKAAAGKTPRRPSAKKAKSGGGRKSDAKKANKSRR